MDLQNWGIVVLSSIQHKQPRIIVLALKITERDRLSWFYRGTVWFWPRFHQSLISRMSCVTVVLFNFMLIALRYSWLKMPPGASFIQFSICRSWAQTGVKCDFWKLVKLSFNTPEVSKIKVLLRRCYSIQGQDMCVVEREAVKVLNPFIEMQPCSCREVSMKMF